jgi:hypothetical protein
MEKPKFRRQKTEVKKLSLQVTPAQILTLIIIDEYGFTQKKKLKIMFILIYTVR